MKKLAIILTVLLFLLPSQAFGGDASKDPGGWRDAKWGMQIYSLKRPECARQGDCRTIINGVDLWTHYRVGGKGGIFRVDLRASVSGDFIYKRMKGIVTALWKKYGKHDDYCLRDRTEHILWRLGGSYIYVRLPRVIGDDFELSYGRIEEDRETLAGLKKLFKLCAGPVQSKI